MCSLQFYLNLSGKPNVKENYLKLCSILTIWGLIVSQNQQDICLTVCFQVLSPCIVVHYSLSYIHG